MTILNTEVRRKDFRREEGKPVVVLAGRVFSIRDWSRGGFFFEAGDLPLKLGDKIPFIMRFTLLTGNVDIEHGGYIVRDMKEGYAIEFDEPLALNSRRSFDSVVDNLVTERFVLSQANIV